MSPTFPSLEVRNYRLCASGALVSNVGTWMGRVAQDWLVLTVLTDHVRHGARHRHRPAVPALPPARAVGRHDRRPVPQAPHPAAHPDRCWPSRACCSACSPSPGVAQLWHVYAIALFQGVVDRGRQPGPPGVRLRDGARRQLTNAVALNSASFNLGRLIGPGAGRRRHRRCRHRPGAAAQHAHLRLRHRRPAAPAQRRAAARAAGEGRGGIREGLALRKDAGPTSSWSWLLVFVLGTFGMNFQITMALMATKVFDKGAGEFGLLGSIMAVGSLTAALLSARRKVPRLRMLLLVASPASPWLPRCRDGADLLAVRAGTGARRPHRPDRADHRQRHGADPGRARHARPGDGPLHGDLHGRHARSERR